MMAIINNFQTQSPVFPRTAAAGFNSGPAAAGTGGGIPGNNSALQLMSLLANMMQDMSGMMSMGEGQSPGVGSVNGSGGGGGVNVRQGGAVGKGGGGVNLGQARSVGKGGGGGGINIAQGNRGIGK